MSQTSSKTRVLVEGALMIAAATVLSYLKLFDLPQGGAITLEMIPLVLMALRNGTKWGCFTAFVHSIIQLIIGFSNVMYCATLGAQILCVLLDYVLAFTALGFAKVFADMFKKNPVLGATVGAVIVGVIRFICSFLSGWILWGSYAWEGWSPEAYSFVYNISYMGPNILIMGVVIFLLRKFTPRLFSAEA